MPTAVLSSRDHAKASPSPSPDRLHTARTWEVLEAASRIEPDKDAVLAWYRDDPIASLDQLTAQTLVASGRHDDVLAFLAGTGAEPAPKHRWAAF
ncbi:hypothetical protein FHW69_000600 [Luteibacter sp. Sphag1AF]|uniref:hypothetical protein n=1 Tax=Luteibacter sp. Sphag1AF TaxID=2587031 RepID=UPI001610A5D4|nr:hypothetical protein [Luteibacter sp. Sphag1AF]MBB3226010.1 hypothetical protein [Luteibacter sp. Sphag1AF]